MLTQVRQWTFGLLLPFGCVDSAAVSMGVQHLFESLLSFLGECIPQSGIAGSDIEFLEELP